MAVPYMALFARSLLILSIFCLGLPAALAQDDTLTVTVYVADQSSEKRVDAFKEAIDIAMRRLTGQQNLESDTHKQVRDSAARYVRGFRYLTKGKADIEAVRITGVRKLLLKVDFNRTTLRRTLSNSEDTNVNTRLPKILFWVAETSRGKRQVVNSQKLSTTAIALKQYSTARGIKMLLPKYDDRERLMISAADIAGGFDSNVLSASSAYIVDKVVTLHLEQLPNKSWRGAWTLLQDLERVKWSAVGRNRNEAISKGINELKSTLDSRGYTNIQVAPSSRILIEVQNIHSLQAYANVNEYLQSLTSVEQVAPVNIKNDRIIFSVQLQSGQQLLERQIAQNNILRVVLNTEFNSTQPSADLTFYYQAR